MVATRGNGHAFTAANPKTCEHTAPRSRGGGTPADIPALRRSCNSSGGPRCGDSQ